MWNYAAIDKTPTVEQVKAIIDYMIADENVKYNFKMMMGMNRPEPNIVLLDLNDAGYGNTFKIIFDEECKIESFESTGVWMS